MVCIALAVALLVGCDGVRDGSERTDREFTGLITDLVSRSLLDLDSIEVTDSDGTSLRFHARGRRFEEFTPGHVREHMLLGLPVVVTYRESDGILIIVEMMDAPVERPGPS